MINYKILKDQIVYFPYVITNHKEIVNTIESLNSKSVSGWEKWYAGAEEEHIYGEIKFMKRGLYSQETNINTLNKCKFVIESLCDYMIDCANVYSEIFAIPNDHLEYAISILKNDGTVIGINKYNENCHMGPHVDLNHLNSYIQYTIVIYLNDDYEGGELNFPNHNIRIKPFAGSIVMYPSGLPYVHESTNVTKGRKMLITHHWRSFDHK